MSTDPCGQPVFSGQAFDVGNQMPIYVVVSTRRMRLASAQVRDALAWLDGEDFRGAGRFERFEINLRPMIKQYSAFHSMSAQPMIRGPRRAAQKYGTPVDLMTRALHVSVSAVAGCAIQSGGFAGLSGCRHSGSWIAVASVMH